MGKYAEFNSNKICSVPQCKSRCTNEISLFFFPKEEPMKKRWADATKIETRITQHMQVCSRHFVKNDYILSQYPGTSNVRRLKRTAVPSQNLPWQFPNKHVSPTLAKARMERLKNRIQQKTSTTPSKEAGKKQDEESTENDEVTTEDDKSIKTDDNEDKTEDNDEDDENDKPEEPSETNETGKDDNEDKVHKGKVVEAKTDDNMPSRAPTRLRQRQGLLKCELCGRKCLTPQALRTHQEIAHKNAKTEQIYPEKKAPTMNKPKEALKRASMPQITVKQTEKLLASKPAVKANKSLNENDIVAKVLQDFDSDGMGTETDYSSDASSQIEILKPEKKGTTKTEFECPKCNRRFAVYFSAFQHIQKHHSGVKTESKVASDVPTVKPNRIEVCTICKVPVTGIHLCLGPQKLSQGLLCSGCHQEFKTLALFDQHKSGMHSEGVESMFFPTLDEFANWKQKMEAQTKVQYTVLDQNDTKQVHRCAAPRADAPRAAARPTFCPSSLIVQEFTKGFQVHYYPDHYGHNYEPYSLSSDFKKYSISSLMNLTSNRLPDDSEDEDKEPDLYLQFKKVTDLLVTEAARINVHGLKKLMRKALEMMTIVNSYVEDQDDDMTASLSISPDNDTVQEEIRKALKTFRAGQRKRVSIELETPAKKKKLLQSTENTIKEQSKTVKLPNPPAEVKEEIENLNETKTGAVTPVNEALMSKNQSPSFIDTFQQFVGKTLVKPVEKKTRSEVKKKQVVKTKIGQFKPSPPKKVNPWSPKTEAVSPSRKSVGSIKEIKYEVKEQENDCNILILKI